MRLYETPAYRRAFEAYIRRGVPIALSLKAEAAEHATTHYIWRTSAHVVGMAALELRSEAVLRALW